MFKQAKLLLPVIVFSQFAGTSLWFAGNAIIDDIPGSTTADISDITSIVQFGFIIGTLVFSLLTIADRFRASHVFFFSSLMAALANIFLLWLSENISWLFTLRFVTGFFLAGIYPVGMKIAADCFPGKLGNALGFLVGALVLGTAFPHLIRSDANWLVWQDVILYTSLLALTGGLLILLIIPGSKIRASSSGVNFNTAFKIFNSKNFRAAAFGYFGHMWELYALWAFTPVIIRLYNESNNANINIPLWSFLTIAAGALGCIIGGIISKRKGSRQIAMISLLISGICCLLSPVFFVLPEILFLVMMLIWGFTVVSDSPQFSTLVAQSAPPENKGTALTIVTSIGFAITIVSIQLLKPVSENLVEFGYLILFIGPVFGLSHLWKYRKED